MSSALFAKTVTLFDLREQKEVSFAQMGHDLDDDALILLGETHYEARVTTALGILIEEIVKLKKAQANYTVAWEFMNYPDQRKIEQSFGLYANEQQLFSDFLQTIFPGQKPQKNLVYQPIFDAAKKYNGKVLATNAPRTWKRIVVAEGIGSLESDQVPQGMQRGSQNYFDRFFSAVGGHGNPAVVEGYFMAQSYTDAVMAEQLVKGLNLQFMIVGYFHTDYGHGLPAYLNRLTKRQIVNVRVVDSTTINEEELLLLKGIHDGYGLVSDYLLLIK
jgi:uncharacterized iron-regulated protein